VRKKIMGRWYDVPDEGDATNEPQITAQQPPGSEQRAQGEGRSTAQAPAGNGGKPASVETKQNPGR
jgi:hypothetical protein